MKKIVKLITLLLVLAGLIVGYVFYSSYMAKKEKENTEEPKDTSVEVLSIDKDSISSIQYIYGEETVSLKKEGEKWQWTEDAELPVAQSYPGNMLEELSYILATRLIAENLDNEADFGMDEPNFAVKYSTTDGKDYVYTIGDYNSAAKGYYIKSSTQDKIYMTDDKAVDAFVYYITDMIEPDTLPEPEAENITKAEYILDGKTYVLTTDSTGADFYTVPYVYFYVGEDGVKVAADGKASGELMNAVECLELGKVVGFKPDEEKLESCGFGENKTVVLNVTFKEEVKSDNSNTSVSVMKENSYSLKIGKGVDEDGKEKYYAMLDGSDILYEISGGAAFFESISADFVSKLVCPLSPDETVSFKVEIGTNVYFYNISDIKNNEKITSIFNSITNLVNYGTTDKAKGNVVMKTTFDMGNTEMILNIYSFDDTNYIASFDKWDNLLVSAEKINNIIKELQS